MSKIADIAAHVQENFSIRCIGGYADPRGIDQHNQGLSEPCVNAIRETLAGSATGASTWDSAPAIN